MLRRTALCGVLSAMMLSCFPMMIHAQKLVFVVRHAERADDGSASTMMQADPPLSGKGEARAAKLADMLEAAGISAIYATEYRRTRDTAGPLARRLNLPIRQASSKDTAGLVERIRRENAKDVVLVVGHSNTVPVIIKGLGGPDVAIPDDEYDNLFVLVPSTGALSRIRFKP